ncbi:MAG: DUF1727 domain-containing protein [Cyanobacteria bacterium SIG31]|nr:DUF1727 domain-containing protein [Cyanobacteria bacterium SIG31]
MKLRFYLSLIIAKFSYIFLKVTKLSSGTAIIGLLTLKICPDFLKYVSTYIKKTKINITGTNGKTTTSGLISHLLKKSGKRIVTNSEGANMLNGIINTLATKICPIRPFEYSVIETDEAFLEKVYGKFNGDYLLVTNLFEDQTDRFANPVYTKTLIQKGIDKNPEVQLILNADEPISASLKSNKASIYFGINNVFNSEGNLVEYEKNSFKCPVCEQDMSYSKNFYSQQGHYSCNCGYKRQTPKYLADVKLYDKHIEISLKDEVFNIPLVGLYNAYNALGAIALAKELGIENINANLKTFKVAFGRSEKRLLNGHDTLIQLIKNPAGTNEVLKTVDLNSNILIAINNNIADGKDISWIEQVNFERLADVNKECIVTGLCAEEIKQRLIKAGVKNTKLIPNIKEAVSYLSKIADGNITILTTYTALLKIDKIKEIRKCY